MSRTLIGGAHSKVVPGLLLALVAALVSGVSVWVNSRAIAHFPDSAVFTSTKNAAVGLVLLGVFAARPGSVRAVRDLSRRKLGLLTVIAVVGGSVPFILFFEGLRQTNAANGAFIQKTLFIWVALLAVPLLRERIGWLQAGAFGLLLGSQLLIGRPKTWELHQGELMILGATALWSAEVVLAKRVMRDVDAGLAATARMAGGAVLLAAYLLWRGKLDAASRFDAEQWRWIALTSAFLLVYVSTWYFALKRAPATAVTSVLTLGAPITAAIQVWDGRPVPVAEQLSGYALLLLAVMMVAAASMLPVKGKQPGASTVTAGLKS